MSHWEATKNYQNWKKLKLFWATKIEIPLFSGQSLVDAQLGSNSVRTITKLIKIIIRKIWVLTFSNIGNSPINGSKIKLSNHKTAVFVIVLILPTINLLNWEFNLSGVIFRSNKNKIIKNRHKLRIIVYRNGLVLWSDTFLKWKLQRTIILHLTT